MSKPDEKLPEDEAIDADAEKAIAEQTPVYTPMTLVRQNEPTVVLEPTLQGLRVKFTAAQLRAMYLTHRLLNSSKVYADDGSQLLAADARDLLGDFLERYPVEFTEPKTDTGAPAS